MVRSTDYQYVRYHTIVFFSIWSASRRSGHFEDHAGDRRKIGWTSGQRCASASAAATFAKLGCAETNAFLRSNLPKWDKYYTGIGAVIVYVDKIFTFCRTLRE